MNQVQTFFGPLSYSLHAGRETGVVEATVQLPTRNPAKKAWLVARVPQGSIKSVRLNGESWTRIDGRLEAIELPQQQGPLKLEIRYR